MVSADGAKCVGWPEGAGWRKDAEKAKGMGERKQSGGVKGVGERECRGSGAVGTWDLPVN